jgi:hypothetical protein
MGESKKRAMSIAEAMRAIQDIMIYYEREGKDGEIIIDIRGGKPIWVKPKIELNKVRVG